jgi:predicted acylesterase/phospholipase RssA
VAYIKEIEYAYDVVVGVSIGAMNGCLLSTFERGLEKLAINWVEKIWLTYPVSAFWTNWDLWLFESLWRSSLLNNEGMKNILALALKDRSVKRGLAI